MKSSAKKLPRSQYELTVKVMSNEMADFWERALAKVNRGVSIKGFRRGRAPQELVIKEVGQEAINQEALDHALSDTYFMALKEHQLSPVAHPQIEVKKYQPSGGVVESTSSDEVALEYQVKIAVMPEVKLKNIEQIKVEPKAALPPTAVEVDQVIDNLRRQKAIFKVTNQPAALGDWVDVGYQGRVDGVVKEAMKNDHHPLILGEGQLIPGFEEQIIGTKQGEKKKFKIKFPQDYHAKDVAGRQAEFDLQVHAIKEVVLPVYDAEFTRDFGFAEPEAMRQAINKNLALEKKQEGQAALQNEVLRQFASRIQVEIPLALIEEEIERMVKDLQQRVEAQGLKWEQYLTSVKHTLDQIKNDLRPQAEQNVKIGLGLGALVKEQKIPIKDEKLIAAQAVDWLVKRATNEVK